MKQILANFFENILSQKDLQEQDKQNLVSYFLGEDANLECLVDIDFSPSELTFLAEHLIASDESCFLEKFLRYHLFFQKYDDIIFLISKMFVAHIGKNPYSSKNALTYDNLQKTFDRFVEASRWTNISFDEWKPMLLIALKSDNSKLLSNWKVPANDFLNDWVVRDEKEFYDFLFSNFADYGMTIFSTLINNNVSSAIPKLVDFWLNNNFDEERQVKNILKSHFEEIEKYVQQLEKDSLISEENLARILIVFENNEQAKNKLMQILEKTKNIELKKLILESLDIDLPDKNLTLAQAKKNSQKLDVANLRFFGLKVSEFPKLVLKNEEIADDNFVAYYLKSYQDLCSFKASGELAFFKKLLNPESMDNFSIFVAQKLLSANDSDDWAFALIQNVTALGAEKLIRSMISVYKTNPKPLNKFLKQYILQNKLQAYEFFNSLNRDIYENKLIQDAMLKNMIELKIYSSNEIESLKDRVVPKFNLNLDGTYEFGGFKMKVNIDFGVDIEKEIYQTIPRPVEIEQKRLLREIQKQIKRLEKAFHNARMWTEKDFKDFIVSNKLMCFLSQNLLWGKYNEGNLVSVFCLKGQEAQNLLSINSKTNDNVIGLFHPVELDDYDIKTMFNGKNAPFNQLYVQVNKMSFYNPHSSSVAKFNGFMVNFAQFFSKIKQFDWKPTIPTLDGYISKLQKANEDLGFVAEINFSPVSLLNLDINIVMGELRFYNIKDVIKTGNNYVVSQANSLELVALPPRYFSDTIYEINMASKKQI